MRTFAERITGLESEIGPKRDRMKSIMQGAIDDDDRDLTTDEQEEFDELDEEVKGLDSKLTRLRAVNGDAATAKAVNGNGTHEASRSRAGRVHAEPAKKGEKGIGFARLVMCYAAAKGNPLHALDIAKQRYPQEQAIQTILKAQVAGGTTDDPSWAAPLVEPTNLISEFVEFLRPMTIVGKFGAGNIPALRRVPFNIKVPVQTTGGGGAWVGEGKPIPLTRFSFGSITLRWTKVGNIAVLSEDLLRFSGPAAEVVVRQSLAEALQGRLDSDFIAPSITETTDVRPASITNGATTYASSGNDAAAVRTDLKKLLGVLIAANIPTGSVVLIMREAQALSLSLMRNELGQREFPEITMTGGFLEGMPVITSQHVGAGIVAAACASEIYLADDGGVAIDMSREASIEMADDPTNAITNNASPPQPVEQQMVSMFQTNSVAIRAERMINWKRRRAAAVAYLTAVGWGNEDQSPPLGPI